MLDSGVFRNQAGKLRRKPATVLRAALQTMQSPRSVHSSANVWVHCGARLTPARSLTGQRQVCKNSVFSGHQPERVSVRLEPCSLQNHGLTHSG